MLEQNSRSANIHPSVFWYIGLVVVMIIWGSMYPAGKQLVSDLHPLWSAFFRFFLAFVPLSIISLIRYRRLRQSSRLEGSGSTQIENRAASATVLPLFSPDSVKIMAFGLLGTGVFSILFFYGIKLATAVNGSVLVNTQPIFATLLAPILIGERFTPLRLFGTVLGVVGMALVVTGGIFSSALFEGDLLAGNIILLAASLSLTLFSIFAKKFINRYGSLRVTAISMGSGSLLIFIVAAIVLGGVGDLAKIHLQDIWILLYMGVVGTALTFFLFNAALTRVGVIRATAFKVLVPVSGTILATLLLGEEPSIAILVGIVIVIASIFFVQTSKERG
ncbi:MAG: DMT family transporter [Spirochaetales bacterium]|nr:DMT family transporter [Spirochaetales bacterium]MCF7939715.1 DMT family transporter [Spirochaetales bacterium]